MKIWRMRFACWIAKATNTPSEFVKTYCFCTVTVVSRTRFGVTFIRTLPILFRIWPWTHLNQSAEFGHAFPVVRTSDLFSARFEVLTACGAVYWDVMLCRWAAFQCFAFLSLGLRKREKLVLLDPENEGIFESRQKAQRHIPENVWDFILFSVLFAACLSSVS